MENKQEISRIYSKSEKKMIVLQPNDRPTVAAYKIFKRPAFLVQRRGEDKSERETSEG